MNYWHFDFRNFQYLLIFMNFILNLHAGQTISLSIRLCFDLNFTAIRNTVLNIIFALMKDSYRNSRIEVFLIFCSRSISLLCIFLNHCSIPHKFNFLLTRKIIIYLHASIHVNYLRVNNHYTPNSTLSQKQSKTPSQL